MEMFTCWHKGGILSLPGIRKSLTGKVYLGLGSLRINQHSRKVGRRLHCSDELARARIVPKSMGPSSYVGILKEQIERNFEEVYYLEIGPTCRSKVLK